jgi:ribosome-binding protein aMBF1 (putative translation factor)
VAEEIGFQPDWTTSPAETIRRALIRRGWSVADLANAMEAEEDVASALVDVELERLDKHLKVGMQSLEDALCNWQKSPGRFISFRG